MLASSYLRTALRGMRRHWSYTLINVFGLSMGFVACFFIVLWIQDELSFNSGYEEGESVFRVMRTATFGPDQVFTWPAVTYMLNDVLDEEYPEIELAAAFSWEQSLALRRDATVFREMGIHAGEDYFSILQHPFLAGDPQSALTRPDGIALSLKLARKYFPEAFLSGDDRAGAVAVLGESINLENRVDVTVTGVYEDPAPNATYRPDFVMSLADFVALNDWVLDWGNNGLRMFVKLAPGADPVAVSAKIRNVVREKADDLTQILFLQSLADMHLRNDYENGVNVGGRIDYVRIFGLVGLFILLIAAINFTNLATARASQRTLEVGVRKTFGSGRGRLALQFLSESVFTALLAFVVAAVAVYVLLTPFNTLTGKEIAIRASDLGMWAGFMGIALLTGMLAGWYPAAYLSSFSVVGVLRKNERGAGRGINLRRGLVVFQFALSVLLIIGAGTVSSQLDFIRSKNLGLDRQDVFFTVQDGNLLSDYDRFKARMMSSTSVGSVAASSNSPLFVGSSTARGVSWEGRAEDDNTLYHILRVSHDYTQTMKMSMVQGRDFSAEFPSDSLNIVVNQSAVTAMGFDEPLGQTVRVWGRTGQIIGVVEDFHFASLYSPIEPLVMRLDPEFTGYAFVRPAPGQTEAALAHFRTVFQEFNPNSPVETTFLDSEFEQTYRSEAVIKKLTTWFTVLAILVACLGLVGLASFTAARRTKEIGVRKVLGASTARIVGLLSREYVLLVLLSFALALPAAWALSNRWLSQFEYHTTIGWPLYLAAAIGVVLITYAAVGYQSLRAAMANPADSLRTE